MLTGINLHVDTCTWYNLGLARVAVKPTADNLLEIVKQRLNEFTLNLYKDIICIQTDGCSTMKSIGNKISYVVGQQLCYAHAIQLAIKDVVYVKRTNNNNEELEEENSDSESESDQDNNVDNPTTSQMNLEHYDELLMVFDDDEITDMIKDDIYEQIEKVRSVVKVFRRGAAESVLDGIVQSKFNKIIKLEFDCSTRWSSMFVMLSKFIKLFDCVQLALKKLKFDKVITKDEFAKLINTDIKPIEQLTKVLHLADYLIKKVSKEDTNLLQAEQIKEFTMNELERLNTPLAIEFKKRLEERFNQRRTSFSKILLYLNDVKSVNSDEINDISLEMIQLINRLIVNGDETIDFNDSNESDLINEDSSSLIENEASENSNNSLNSKYNSFVSTKNKTTVNTKDSATKEVENYVSFGIKGQLLIQLENMLMTIKASTVDVERVFSQSKLVLTSLRSRLSDHLLDDLVFMKYYFQSNI